MKVRTKDVRNIVGATFPEYRKLAVRIEVTKKVQFMDVNWFEGTKATYKACTIEGEAIREKVDMGTIAPWHNPFEGMEIDLPVNVVVVESKVFCGREMALRLYVHPENMAKLVGNEVPAAACPRCGGWTPCGGMSQHATSEVEVLGRKGCTCNR